MLDRNKIIRLMRKQARAAHNLRAAPGGLRKWIGRVVKIGFDQHTDPAINQEWMWVEIRAARDEKLVGVLLNHPRYATQSKHGDTVVLGEADIVALDLPQRKR